MLLAGKRVLVAGLLTQRSIAAAVARRALYHGAAVVTTAEPRHADRARAAASRLAPGLEVVAADLTVPGDLDHVRDVMAERWGSVDGVVHCVAYAPASCIGTPVTDMRWADLSRAIEISAYSFLGLTRALCPLLSPDASLVALDFDSRLVWPNYNGMGVAKATLESLTRYLARDLGPRGVRVNLVCSGPLQTVSERAIPGYRRLEALWGLRAPLGWKPTNHDAVGDACVALLSGLLGSTTGEMVHVDGGAHAVGAGRESFQPALEGGAAAHA
jgi:enoyl-[acyl-carrier protein] reductase I